MSGLYPITAVLLRSLASFVAVAMLGLLTWPVAAAEPVKVGCVEFPPLTYTGGDGRATGRAVELVSVILERAGLEYQVTCYPGARLMASLRDGSVQVAMLIRHPELLSSVQYGALPMARIDLRAYRRAGTTPLGRVENSRGNRVVVLRGYGYGGWIDFFRDPANNVTVSYADSREAAVRMLSGGHGDYLIDYVPPEVLGAEDEAFLVETLTRLDTYFVVSNKAPNPTALLRRIEDIFADMGARPVE